MADVDRPISIATDVRFAERDRSVRERGQHVRSAAFVFVKRLVEMVFASTNCGRGLSLNLDARHDFACASGHVYPSRYR